MLVGYATRSMLVAFGGLAAGAALLPCPATRWDAKPPIALPPARSFIHTVAKPNDLAIDDEHAWLASMADDLMPTVERCGAIHFRGFDVTKSKEGFRKFCSALPLRPCCDPLSSIGVRSLLSEAEGIYEAVDAASTASTFIGLHNDATYKLAAPYAAFVCFQPAASGGAFLLADGHAILRAIEPRVLEQLLARQMRVRVAALPIGRVVQPLPSTLQAPLRTLIRALVGAGIRLALPLDLDVAWAADGEVLQILEQAKPAVNRHPRTQLATFFSGIHSQSRALQQRRAGAAFSGVAATDVYWGDGGPIEEEVLDHLDETITKHTTPLLMEAGDVVLLDSYSVLHGRQTFRGARQHGVQWLSDGAGGGSGVDQGGDAGGGGASLLSGLVNQLAVKRPGRSASGGEG